MPKWVMSVLLGFVGLTLALVLISAVVPSIGTSVNQYVKWTTDTGNSCLRNRAPGDQAGLC